MHRIAANISLLFRELPLLERFQAARTAGFDGVEMQFPYAESAGDLSRAAEAAGRPVVLINAPVSPEHPSGIAGRPDMCGVFRGQLAQTAEYAEALGVRFVHVLAGRIDSSENRERCVSTYVENLSRAADALAPYGVTVLVEALNANDVPHYLMGTLGEACSVLERCPAGVGLQFDLYHVARMGLDPAAELPRVLPQTRHVQFADAPGRHEPGSGRVAFGPVVAVLEAAAYEGWLGAACVPRAAPSARLAWRESWRHDT